MRDVTLEQDDLQEELGAATEELTDERPPEKNLGAESSRVGLRIMSRVSLHADERKLGMAFGSDCGYLIPNEKKARFPDGSFVAKGRLPDERTPQGNLKLAPDLVLEVVSPNDLAFEVEEKRVAYLRGGVRLLWVVYPPSRTVFVFRLASTVALLGEGDTLSGEDVLPDFRCLLAQIFEDL